MSEAPPDYEGSLKIVRQNLSSKLGFKKSEFWFVLHDNVLSWHRRRGEVPVDFFLLQEAKTITPDGVLGIVIQTNQESKALLLTAVSPDDRDKWVSVLVSKAKKKKTTKPKIALTRPARRQHAEEEPRGVQIACDVSTKTEGADVHIRVISEVDARLFCGEGGELISRDPEAHCISRPDGGPRTAAPAAAPPEAVGRTDGNEPADQRQHRHDPHSSRDKRQHCRRTVPPDFQAVGVRHRRRRGCRGRG